MDNVKKSLKSGFAYVALTKYTGIFITIIIGATMSRLVGPEEFGIIASTFVFITFFNTIEGFGIGPSIIQNRDLNKEDIKSLFIFSIYIAVIFSLIFYNSANYISAYFERSELILVTKLLSITVFFSSLCIVPNALLLKSKSFKTLGILTLVAQVLGGAIGIILAFNGYSYFSIIYRSIFISIITFLILYFLNPIKIDFTFKIISIKKVFRFSIFQFGFNLVNYFSRNLDNIFIGKYLGQSALGFYEKSYTLMLLPAANLTHIITPVLHPVLSEAQNDYDKVYRTYIDVLKILSIIGVSVSSLFFFSSKEIILILYGEDWYGSIDVFRILSVSIWIQIILSSSGAIFQVLNRTDLLFKSGLISAVFMISAICYGIFYESTLIAVGKGLIIAFLINFFQGFYFLIKLGFRKSFFDFLKIFRFPILMGFTMSISLYFVSSLMSINMYVDLMINIILIFIVFFSMIFLSKEYKLLVKKIINK